MKYHFGYNLSFCEIREKMQTLNYFQELEAAAGLVAEREWGSQAWYTKEGAVVPIETYLQVKIDPIASCP